MIEKHLQALERWAKQLEDKSFIAYLRITDLIEDYRKYKEALRFYANRDNYEWIIRVGENEYSSRAADDYGKVAREVLGMEE